MRNYVIWSRKTRQRELLELWDGLRLKARSWRCWGSWSPVPTQQPVVFCHATVIYYCLVRLWASKSQDLELTPSAEDVVFAPSISNGIVIHLPHMTATGYIYFLVGGLTRALRPTITCAVRVLGAKFLAWYEQRLRETWRFCEHDLPSYPPVWYLWWWSRASSIVTSLVLSWF